MAAAWGGLSKRRPDAVLPESRSDLQLSSHECLDACVERTACPNCGQKRKYFCYDCLLAFTPTPKLDLPVNVHFVLHPHELRSKSTGVHGALLANNAEDAKTPAELLAEGDLPTDVVVIDSTWEKAAGVVKSQPIGKLRKVKLSESRTCFWRSRPMKVSGQVAIQEGCSSVEAAYYLSRELHAAAHAPGEPCHCFDDLLWYFDFIHRKVQSRIQSLPDTAIGDAAVAEGAADHKRATRRGSNRAHADGGGTTVAKDGEHEDAGQAKVPKALNLNRGASIMSHITYKAWGRYCANHDRFKTQAECPCFNWYYRGKCTKEPCPYSHAAPVRAAEVMDFIIANCPHQNIQRPPAWRDELVEDAD